MSANEFIYQLRFQKIIKCPQLLQTKSKIPMETSQSEEQFLEEQIKQTKIRKCNAIFDRLTPDPNDYVQIDRLVITNSLARSLTSFFAYSGKSFERSSQRTSSLFAEIF